jgi:hypothetical protein
MVELFPESFIAAEIQTCRHLQFDLLQRRSKQKAVCKMFFSLHVGFLLFLQSLSLLADVQRLLLLQCKGAARTPESERKRILKSQKEETNSTLAAESSRKLPQGRLIIFAAIGRPPSRSVLPSVRLSESVHMFLISQPPLLTEMGLIYCFRIQQTY